jgi:hypothetical protein
MVPFRLPDRQRLNPDARVQQNLICQVVHCKFCFNEFSRQACQQDRDVSVTFIVMVTPRAASKQQGLSDLKVVVKFFSEGACCALRSRVDQTGGHERSPRRQRVDHKMINPVALRRRGFQFLAPRPGLEPGTYGLTVRRSTN